MHESPAELEELQHLLDRSYAAGGPHLLSIHTSERRMTATQLAARLTGMRLLVLATATGDGRPITGPVDGIFFRGAFYFGSGANSVRFRHIAGRPEVSATHLPEEAWSVTVHGTAARIDLNAPEHARFRQALIDIYVPKYSDDWVTTFLEGGPVYARIDAAKMFAFNLWTNGD
jgi:nitroimidazol reductase NimA-like FMN-containing flavoprotein (pyridoxamine 5'-phosphate oxidase superfamily)